MRENGETADVAVVGGGLAGLAAAALVAREGRRVVLVERAGELGGRARSQEEAGFLLNQGAHALYRAGAGARVLTRLGVRFGGGQPKGAGGFALKGGVLHTLPAGPVSLLSTGLLPLAGRLELARALTGLLRADARDAAGGPLAALLEARVASREVREVVGAFFRLTTYCADFAHLDGGAALVQLQRAIGKGVLYLDGGWQALVEGLLAQARAAGVRAEAHARAEAVEAVEAAGAVGAGGPGAWRVRLADGRGVGARAVVLAVPPREAARLLGGDAQVAAWAAEARPQRAACLDVGLRRLPRPGHLSLQGVDTPDYAAVHSHLARLAPEGGGAVLHAVRYLTADDAAPPESVLEGLLDRLQPGWREEVVVRRYLPSMTVAHALPAATRRGERAPLAPAHLPGVLLAGDWVGSEGMLADAALASAEAAAAAALALTAAAGTARARGQAA
jgi:phytoene dehydrogenase-like protein